MSLLLLAAATALGQDAKNVITIPITVSDDNYVRLKVRVNGGPPLDFIFDTGANICLLTERGKAKTNGLKFDAAQETLGSGGVSSRPMARSVSLSIADHRWAGQPLMFVDYGGSLKADGVIGYNLFADKTITLDYDRGVLEAGDGLPRSVKGLPEIKVKMIDDLAFIPATLQLGSESVTDLFEMDTGFTGAASVSPKLAEKAHLPGDLRRLGSGKMGGTGPGVIQIVSVELPVLSLGAHRMPKVPADVQLPSGNDFKVWNLLGNDYLKRFNIVWDIRGRKLFVWPNHLAGDPYDLHPNRRPILLLIGSLVLLFLIGLIGVLRRRKAERNRGEPISA
jgi:predicted aspartyl protease